MLGIIHTIWYHLRVVRKFKSNRNEGYSCPYPVVWCPKYRRRVLINAVDDRLKTMIREVAAERRAETLAIEVMPDPVHGLISADPQFGIHRLVRLVKGRSSRVLRQEFPGLRSRWPTW